MNTHMQTDAWIYRTIIVLGLINRSHQRSRRHHCDDYRSDLA